MIGKGNAEWNMQRQKARASATTKEPSIPVDVVLPNPTGVSGFLAGDPQLAKLIPSVCRHVRKCLGPAVELSLEVYSDPEIDDRYLTLYVRQEHYEVSIMDQIEQARAGLMRSLARVAGRLFITTDFCPPRRDGNAIQRVRGTRRHAEATRGNGRRRAR